MHVSSELIVQIKQKGVYRVEYLLPRNFLSGMLDTGPLEKKIQALSPNWTWI